MKHAHPQKEAGRDMEKQGTELMQEPYDYINYTLNKISKKSSVFFKVREFFDKLNVKIVPIPLKAYSKTPSITGWTEDTYNPDLYPWARHYGNIGIIIGRSNLIVFDCDSTETVQFFEDLAKKTGLDLNTLIIETRKGRHYYYSCNFSKELERRQFHNNQIRLDILAGNKYQVVAPFSTLKLDENNQILDRRAENYILFEYKPIHIPDELAEITREQYEAIIFELERQFKQKQKEEKQAETKTEIQEERELTEEEIEKLYEIILEHFREGIRQNLLLYLCGFLRKALKISENSVYRLYEKFINIDDPKDIKSRLAAIRKTFEKDETAIAGYTKLCEFLEKEKAEELCRRIRKVLNIPEKRKLGETIEDYQAKLTHFALAKFVKL
jgi:hypothetical protein